MKGVVISMNDISFLSNYAIPLIIGICLCIGYILKNVITNDKVNKYIPLILAVIGVLINVWINMRFTPEVLLGGLFSGLASTGLHQLFKNFIENMNNNKN